MIGCRLTKALHWTTATPRLRRIERFRLAVARERPRWAARIAKGTVKRRRIIAK